MVAGWCPGKFAQMYSTSYGRWLRCIVLHVEGSRPEWCMSSMIYSGDTPFWSETLDMVAGWCPGKFAQMYSASYGRWLVSW